MKNDEQDHGGTRLTEGAGVSVSVPASVAPHDATLYERVRNVVARMDASIQGEATKEQYLKRVFDDVTVTVITETLLAVSEHCEKRGGELWATGHALNKSYAASYYTLQDWCVDQIKATNGAGIPEEEGQ